MWKGCTLYGPSTITVKLVTLSTTQPPSKGSFVFHAFDTLAIYLSVCSFFFLVPSMSVVL